MNTIYTTQNFEANAVELISYFFQKIPTLTTSTALINLLKSPLALLQDLDDEGRVNWAPIFFDLFNNLENNPNLVTGDVLDRLGDFLGQERISLPLDGTGFLFGSIFGGAGDHFDDPNKPFGSILSVQSQVVGDSVYIDILRARVIKIFSTASINDMLRSLKYLFNVPFIDLELTFPDANTVDINVTVPASESFDFMVKLFNFTRLQDNDFLWIRPITRAVYNLIEAP